MQRKRKNMKEKIEKKIKELWERIREEIKYADRDWEEAKKFLRKKQGGNAVVGVAFTIMHLKNIEDNLDAIEMLERLSEEENERKD